MKKKKSYMNNKNILSEGLIKNILGIFKALKKVKKLGLTSAEKKLLKDPTIKKDLNKFNKTLADLDKSLLSQAKRLGIEDEVKKILDY